MGELSAAIRARAFHRALKLSRTIADLAGSDLVGAAFLSHQGSITCVPEEPPELLAEPGKTRECQIEVGPAGRVWAALADQLWLYEGAGSE